MTLGSKFVKLNLKSSGPQYPNSSLCQRVGNLFLNILRNSKVGRIIVMLQREKRITFQINVSEFIHFLLNPTQEPFDVVQVPLNRF